MVVHLDGTLVLAGGEQESGTYVNDVWASANGGLGWALLTSTASWSVRILHAMVRLDGALVLAGGCTGMTSPFANDIWTSTDGGSIWVEVTVVGTHWSPRSSHAMAVSLDGTLVVATGTGTNGQSNDVWISTSGGISWVQITSGAAWSARYIAAMVVRLDGTFVLAGGATSVGNVQDVWITLR